MSRRAIAWRRELLLLSILGMDATWLTPWVAVLTGTSHDPGHGLSLATVLALLLALLAATRVLVASRLLLGTQQVLAGALAVVAALVLIGARLYGHYPFAGLGWLPAWLDDLWRVRGYGISGLVFLGLALYASGRSISLAQNKLETSAVGFYLRFGIVAWFWFYLYGLLAQADASLVGPFLFFFLGLVAVGLSRVEEVHNERGAVRSPFTGSWLLIMAAASLGVVGLGVLVIQILSRRLVGAAWRALGPVWRVVGWLFARLVQAIFLLLTPLLDALARTLAPAGEQLIRVPTPSAVETPMPAGPQPTGMPAPVRLIIMAGGALLLLAIVALIVTALQRREEPGEGWGERETAWEGAAGEGGGLGGGLRRLRRRLVDALAVTHVRSYPLASAREIYASVQRLASRGGVRRNEAETPYEYRCRLDEAWPEAGEGVASITEAYVRAHYGERQIDEQELEALRAHWRRLRELVEGQKTSGLTGPPGQT